MLKNRCSYNLITGVFIILSIVLGLCGCSANNTIGLDELTQREDEVLIETNQEATANADNDTDIQTKLICVFVCGAVANPGVYELVDGSRVCDAIDAAGGFLEASDKLYLNLARVLTDGERLYVPDLSEADSEKRAFEDEISATESKVNINTASVDALCTVPGIGKTRAEAIISYRSEKGLFSAVEDIKQVSGIGDTTFEKIQEYICVN